MKRNAIENILLLLFAAVALPVYVLYLLAKNAK